MDSKTKKGLIGAFVVFLVSYAVFSVVMLLNYSKEEDESKATIASKNTEIDSYKKIIETYESEMESKTISPAPTSISATEPSSPNTPVSSDDYSMIYFNEEKTNYLEIPAGLKLDYVDYDFKNDLNFSFTFFQLSSKITLTDSLNNKTTIFNGYYVPAGFENTNCYDPNLEGAELVKLPTTQNEIGAYREETSPQVYSYTYLAYYPDCESKALEIAGFSGMKYEGEISGLEKADEVFIKNIARTDNPLVLIEISNEIQY